MTSTIDYDLHGVVRVRLLDATPADAAVITRQLGPIQTDVDGRPDITIRFVDRLETASPVRYIGLDDAAYTDDAYLVLRSKHKASARVQIPMDRIGEGCDIVVERGLPAVPLLIAIVNMTALSKGVVPLHASAFTYEGKGVVVTGWAKAGKTEALLSFMARGATYIGDEWIYLSCDGEKMFDIPEPIRLWTWQLEQMPRYQRAVSAGDRRKLRLIGVTASGLDRLASNGLARRTLPTGSMTRFAAALKRQLNVQIPPAKLFGADACQPTGRPDLFIFMVSHDSARTGLEPMDAYEIAERMVFSSKVEYFDLLTHYWKFRFAFPDRPNPLIERLQALELETLRQALGGKKTYRLAHPHPVSIPALFDIIYPVL